MLQFSQLKEYMKLMRLHQTTGIWLVLWPGIWGILFASNQIIPLKLIIIFFIGSIFARAGGCIINDIIDKDIDKFVERTKNRPVASGRISVNKALIFLAIISAICLIILLQLPSMAIIIGIFSIIPIIMYPFMKRVTFWPQLFLGFTFNMSSLIGIASVINKINLGGLLLYLGCVFWTLGYDTIYGHQDRRDDLLIGVKSTSIAFGKNTKSWLVLFYTGFISLLVVTGFYFNLAIFLYLIPSIIHLAWQIFFLDIENAQDCFQKFVSNKYLGWFISLGIVASKITFS